MQTKVKAETQDKSSSPPQRATQHW